jgi:hypothetical protein
MGAWFFGTGFGAGVTGGKKARSVLNAQSAVNNQRAPPQPTNSKLHGRNFELELE